MASVIKRNKSFCVVYSYVTKSGKTKQKWETFATKKEANARKAEVEVQITRNTFIAPRDLTVKEFLEDFVTLYGEKKWSLSMYSGSVGLIRNYIIPAIGDRPIQETTTKEVDKLIRTLERTTPVSSPIHKARTEFLTSASINKIIKLMRCAFNQAVRWDMVAKNPFEHAVLPEYRGEKRDIMDADTIRKALNACTDSRLYIAMNLSFACSLRLGEILGLTWNNVHITDADIDADDAWIYVNKELARATKDVIETLNKKDVYKVFDPLLRGSNTCLVLKHPKTDSSVRKVWLPKTVALILRKWQASQNELKAFLGSEYEDHGLVVAHKNGRPCDGRVIEKAFSKLKKEAGLPNVVFHSLRHSSTTYKLKLNHGDLKATQGDTGHAEIDMITKVYAHILDEDRKINAQKFESTFYAQPDLHDVHPPQKNSPQFDLAALVAQLKENPELANTLATLLAAGG